MKNVLKNSLAGILITGSSLFNGCGKTVDEGEIVGKQYEPKRTILLPMMMG